MSYYLVHNRNKINVPGFFKIIFGSRNHVFVKNFWLPKGSVRKLGFCGFGCVFYFCLMRWYLGKFFFKFFYPRNAPPKLKLLEYIMICFVNFYLHIKIWFKFTKISQGTFLKSLPLVRGGVHVLLLYSSIRAVYIWTCA